MSTEKIVPIRGGSLIYRDDVLVERHTKRGHLGEETFIEYLPGEEVERGAGGGGGGGGLPTSTGANKVLFDDGATQAWSDAPFLAGLALGDQPATTGMLRLSNTGAITYPDLSGSPGAVVSPFAVTAHGPSPHRPELVIGSATFQSMYIEGFDGMELAFDQTSETRAAGQHIGLFGCHNSDTSNYSPGTLLFGRR